MFGPEKHHFKPNWLEWPIDRRDRTFRVYVVEPRTVCPENHPSIFRAAFQLFMPAAEPEYLGEATRPGFDAPPVPVDRFDLLTFPEAFLPSDTLIEVLTQIGQAAPTIGCVHTGLRPAGIDANATHLFPLEDLRKLVQELGGIPGLAADDLVQFKGWLAEQKVTDRFNIGCLFTVDAAGKLRICLHPKFIRSQFEISPEHERDMTEANLLSLVTLRPTQQHLLPITIQPLICSDILNLPTDDPSRNHPIEGVTSDRSCFSAMYSDHVEIVSVATCTPTSKAGHESFQLEWHQKFLDSFRHAAADDQCRRHHFAAFVLSNFRYFAQSRLGETPGGLSGVFIPLPVYSNPFQEYVTRPPSILGRFPREAHDAGKEERWNSSSVNWNALQETPILGYLVSLDPETSKDQASATLFGFKVTNLPRDANRWLRRGSISNFSIHHATTSPSDNGQPHIEFKPLKQRGSS